MLLVVICCYIFTIGVVWCLCWLICCFGYGCLGCFDSCGVWLFGVHGVSVASVIVVWLFSGVELLVCISFLLFCG